MHFRDSLDGYNIDDIHNIYQPYYNCTLCVCYSLKETNVSQKLSSFGLDGNIPVYSTSSVY